MTLRLILMRHAKSSWDNLEHSDHERVLNARGVESARAIGTWLATKGYIPEQVLSSDSARTRETWDRIAPMFGDVPVHWMADLYHASAATMLRALRGATGETVLMIGHNPGIADFADRLVITPPDHRRFCDYPTAATTVMDFEIDKWRDVDMGMARPIDFVIPHEIIAG